MKQVKIQLSDDQIRALQDGKLKLAVVSADAVKEAENTEGGLSFFVVGLAPDYDAVGGTEVFAAGPKIEEDD